MVQRRGPWSQQEDERLMHLVQTQGALNWVRISNMLGSRTPKQCRERYHQNLKPTLNHSPITAEEGRLIEAYVRDHGKRWADIARRLSGRSDNAVKNWWNGSQNRRRRMERRRNGSNADAYEDGPETQRPEPQHQRPETRSREMQLYPGVPPPQTLPVPSARALPAPLMTVGLQNYHIENPLSSPGFTPDSERAPSLVSDASSVYTASPGSDCRLPPLKMGGEGTDTSPRPPLSPMDNNLPPLSAVYPSPEFNKAEPRRAEARHHHPALQSDYFSLTRSHALPQAHPSHQLHSSLPLHQQHLLQQSHQPHPLQQPYHSHPSHQSYQSLSLHRPHPLHQPHLSQQSPRSPALHERRGLPQLYQSHQPQQSHESQLPTAPSSPAVPLPISPISPTNGTNGEEKKDTRASLSNILD